MFIYLDLYSLLIELYSLLCFVLHSVLTCMRQETVNEQYRNTVETFFYLTPSAKRMKIPHTARLDDTAILHVKIQIAEIPHEKKLNTMNLVYSLIAFWMKSGTTAH